MHDDDNSMKQLNGRIEFILEHPTMSTWLKETLVSALKRDPNAVLNDLEILNVTLKPLCEVRAAEVIATLRS